MRGCLNYPCARLLPYIALFPLAGLSTPAVGQEDLWGPGWLYASAWSGVRTGLHGAFGSVDVRYARHRPPEGIASTQWSGVGWRGERLHAQLVLWSRSAVSGLAVQPAPLRSEDGKELPAGCVRPAFVRYVLADGVLTADPLDAASAVDLPLQTVQPVWLSVDIPRDAAPGVYSGHVTASATGVTPLVFTLIVEVLPATLPAPHEWEFWLDIWQNPWMVAKYHQVQPWSAEHVAILEPHLRLLADAGQKTVTAWISPIPWSSGTADVFRSHVQWIRRPDGSFTWDYSVFDQWVELCERCGIRRAINCFSMLSWDNTFYFRHEGKQKWGQVTAVVGTPEYERHWRPFLASFVAHLRERGWQDRVCMALDERPQEAVAAVVKLLRSAAPELKVALASEYPFQPTTDIHDWSAYLDIPLDPQTRAARVGKITTFYVCCVPKRPNTFVTSPPAEATWMGWYAAAMGYSGFLRWAYDAWSPDPLTDASRPPYTAGDCFLVYPGARSSIRFERLREGIQDFEKVHRVRAALQARTDDRAKAALAALQQQLDRFNLLTIALESAAGPVRGAKAALVEASRCAYTQ